MKKISYRLRKLFLLSLLCFPSISSVLAFGPVPFTLLSFQAPENSGVHLQELRFKQTEDTGYTFKDFRLTYDGSGNLLKTTPQLDSNNEVVFHFDAHIPANDKVSLILSGDVEFVTGGSPASKYKFVLNDKGSVEAQYSRNGDTAKVKNHFPIATGQTIIFEDLPRPSLKGEIISPSQNSVFYNGDNDGFTSTLKVEKGARRAKEVEFRIFQQGDLAPHDHTIEVKRAPFRKKLIPFTKITFSQYFDTENWPEGDYYLDAVVRGRDGQEILKAESVRFEIKNREKRLPDLTVEDIVYEERKSNQGATLKRVTAKVCNRGNEIYDGKKYGNGQLSTRFYVNGKESGHTWHKLTLNAGECTSGLKNPSASISNLGITQPGIYIFTAKVDTKSTVPELNESNNHFKKNLDIDLDPGNELPDLIINKIKFVPYFFEDDKNTLTIYATVKNIGNIPSKETHIYFSNQNGWQDIMSVPKLGVDQELTAKKQILIEKSHQGKYHYFDFKLDSSNFVDELNENNNHYKEKVYIDFDNGDGSIADLSFEKTVIRQMPGKFHVNGNGFVDVNAIVKNIGDTKSDTFKVSLYVDEKFKVSGGGYSPLGPGGTTGPSNVGSGGYYTPGWHTYKFVITPYGEDQVSGNNVFSGNFYVKEEVKPSVYTRVMTPNGGEVYQNDEKSGFNARVEVSKTNQDIGYVEFQILKLAYPFKERALSREEKMKHSQPYKNLKVFGKTGVYGRYFSTHNWEEGQYFLQAKVYDRKLDLISSDISDRSFQIKKAPTITRLPDLVIEDLQYQKGYLNGKYYSKRSKVTAKVCNRGNSKFDSLRWSSHKQMFVNFDAYQGESGGTMPYVKLEPGECTQGSDNAYVYLNDLDIDETGYYNVTAKIDTQNKIAELNEYNNSYKENLHVDIYTNTCNAIFTGWKYDHAQNNCVKRSITACSNPFPYKTYLGCRAANIFEDEEHEDEVEENEYEDDVVTKDFFPDTNPSSLEGKSARYLRGQEVIGGFPDGEFKGDRPVNRAELAKFLLLADGFEVSDLKNNGRFPDVKEGEWYVKYVVTAANEGIVNGYPNGLFKPAQTVNTAEFLKMLSETFSLPKNISHTYRDVESNDWFDQYAGIARRYNLFPHRSFSYLNASQELTRNEVAVALYQYLTGGQNVGSSSSSSPDYTDQEEAKNAILVEKNEALDAKVEVHRNKKDIKALSLRFETRNKAGEIKGIKFRRIGNGNWSDFRYAWLEKNNQIVSPKVLIKEDNFTIPLNQKEYLSTDDSSSLVLKVDMSGNGSSGNSSRFVVFLPEWIETTSYIDKVGFFPFGGFDIEIE